MQACCSRQTAYRGISAIPAATFGYGVILALVFYLRFAPIAYLPDRSIIKYGMILIVGLFVLYHIKIVLQKKYLSMNILLFLFAIVCFISSIVNRNSISSRDPFLAAIVGIGTIVEALLVIEVVVEKLQPKYVVNVFYWLTIVTVIITDVLIFLAPSLYHQYGGYYFSGNKFGVAYLHAQLLMFFLLRRRFVGYKTIGFYILLCTYTILSIVMSICVDCMTGLILVIIFLLGYFVFNKLKSILSNPFVVVIVLLISCSILVGSSTLLENEHVRYFIVEILGRSPTMTGRTHIFEQIFKVISDNALLGYGYGSAYEITMEIIGAPNAQNGLLNWVIECGVLSACLIVVMLFNSFRKVKYNQEQLYPLVVMMYGFSLTASVEVCIGGMFFILMFMVYVFSSHLYHKEKNNGGRLG